MKTLKINKKLGRVKFKVKMCNPLERLLVKFDGLKKAEVRNPMGLSF